MLSEAPVRLCCFQRHYGPQCPDGKVMCCMCFGRFEVADLDVDPDDGKPWDVCKRCGEQERKQIRRRVTHFYGDGCDSEHGRGVSATDDAPPPDQPADQPIGPE